MGRRKRSAAEKALKPLRLEITDLVTGQCRFAVEEGERGRHLFCGLPVKEGSPWCPVHHAICTDKP